MRESRVHILSLRSFSTIFLPLSTIYIHVHMRTPISKYNTHVHIYAYIQARVYIDSTHRVYRAVERGRRLRAAHIHLYTPQLYTYTYIYRQTRYIYIYTRGGRPSVVVVVAGGRRRGQTARQRALRGCQRLARAWGVYYSKRVSGAFIFSFFFCRC